jgi:8-oxo-dGTP pyrophosphatase MutT (NUDIX family)
MKHAAGVVLVRSDGAVLVQLRDMNPGIVNPGHWGIVGGQALDGESNEAAARRELEEETGYRVKELRLLIEEAFIRSDGEELIRHIYWAPYDDHQTIECREGAAVEFIHPGHFAGKVFARDHERILRLAAGQAQERNVGFFIRVTGRGL